MKPIHGEARNGKETTEYHTWTSIRQRCRDTSSRAARWYSGRGIKVCDRWCGKHGYEHFLEDMGRRPPDKTSLDRIDSDKGYSPDNCRWATWHEQQNNRRNTTYITVDGETKSAANWARTNGIPHSTIQNRIARGWQPERAATQKPHRAPSISAGDKFGCWEVIKAAARDSKRRARWTCKCKCGTIKDLTAYRLTSGHAASCKSCSLRLIWQQRRGA